LGGICKTAFVNKILHTKHNALLFVKSLFNLYLDSPYNMVAEKEV